MRSLDLTSIKDESDVHHSQRAQQDDACHITPKGSNKMMHAVTFLTNNTATLYYVFIYKFSFISYYHITEIVEQIAIILDERVQKGKPFGDMNFIFFGDYEQLSKSTDKPMYFRA